MKKCTFCGTENTEENIFCELCGHRFEARAYDEPTAFQNEIQQEANNVNKTVYAPTENADPPKNETPTENADPPKKETPPAKPTVDNETKDCPFCNGSGKADYLVQSGFKTILKEFPCHICVGTGKVDAEIFTVISKELNMLREQAVASGKIRDNCPTCRGYGYAFTRKVFGVTAIYQIVCPSCTGRKITYSKKG